MNIFRLAGDMSHVVSIFILLLRLIAKKNANGEAVGVDLHLVQAGARRGVNSHSTQRLASSLLLPRQAYLPATPFPVTPSPFFPPRCPFVRARHLAQDAGALSHRLHHALPRPLHHLLLTLQQVQGTGWYALSPRCAAAGSCRHCLSPLALAARVIANA